MGPEGATSKENERRAFPQMAITIAVGLDGEADASLDDDHVSRQIG
jgi:hypothetical protein